MAGFTSFTFTKDSFNAIFYDEVSHIIVRFVEPLFDLDLFRLVMFCILLLLLHLVLYLRNKLKEMSYYFYRVVFAELTQAPKKKKGLFFSRG
ncbi:MAG: hypothetical protein ACEQSK_04450 [Sphingomonadaceae bacterium]